MLIILPCAFKSNVGLGDDKDRAFYPAICEYAQEQFVKMSGLQLHTCCITIALFGLLLRSLFLYLLIDVHR